MFPLGEGLSKIPGRWVLIDVFVRFPTGFAGYRIMQLNGGSYYPAGSAVSYMKGVVPATPYDLHDSALYALWLAIRLLLS